MYAKRMKIKVKVRRSWGIMNPATKVIPNKTKYSRKQKHRKQY